MLSNVGPVYRKKMSQLEGHTIGTRCQLCVIFFFFRLPWARERFKHFFINRCIVFINLTLRGEGGRVTLGGGQWLSS